MPITVQGAARPKLNLPPLRAIDGGKTVDAAELDRFTRAIAEWGVKVDQWNNDQDGTIDGLEARVTALELVTTPTDWTDVTFQNSWVNYDVPGPTARDVSYRRVGDIVYLRGVMKNGTMSTTAFNLPEGFRPGLAFDSPPANSGGAVGFVNFTLGGDVVPFVGVNTYFFLDGLYFSTTP